MSQPALRAPEKGKLRNEPLFCRSAKKGIFSKQSHFAGPLEKGKLRNKAIFAMGGMDGLFMKYKWLDG